MILEIENVEIEGDPNSVIVRVNYWHDKKGRGKPNTPPDFIEDHIIRNIPALESIPLRTPLGQYVGIDGSPVPPWEMNDDGEWVALDPHSIEDEIQWATPDRNEEDYILDPIMKHAAKVKAEGKRGADVVPGRKPGRNPIPRNTKASSIAQKIIGRVEDI